MNNPSPQLQEKKQFSLPRLALRFPHLTLVLSLLMVALGVYSFLTIPQRNVPMIPTPNIGVVTQFPGMSAEDMDRYITRPLEKRLQIAGGIQYVLGVSQESYSKIVVYFRYDVDIAKKRQELKNLLDVVANELPRAGANQTVPRVIQVDRQNAPLIQFAVRRDGYDRGRLKELLNNIILTQFQKIPGVQAAWTFGGTDRQVQIVADRNKLAAYNLSILEIRRAIDAANFDRGAGALLDGDREIQVRVPNEFREDGMRERLRKLPVGKFGARVVYLKEVAEVRDTVATQYGDFFYNGEPAIWLGVQPEPTRNFMTIADEAKRLTTLLATEYPGLSFDIVFDKTYFIDLNDRNALFEFFLAVALASLVMLLFLGELSAMLIAAAILPSAVAFGFFVIDVMGFQKDVGITLGLVFVVGKLLDDSIIVVEVIRRHLERGESPRRAAILGAEEVQKAVAAATFTFVVILIPMTQMTGDMGSGFLSMTIPMITSVIGSYLLAMTLTPLMASYLFKPSKRESSAPVAGGGDIDPAAIPPAEPPPDRVGRLIHWAFLKHFHRFEHAFARVVDLAVDYRWVVVALTVASLYLTSTLFDQLGEEQMPLTDTSVALGYLRADPGTSFDRTREIVQDVERIALENKNVKDASALTGKSPVWGQFFTGYGVNRVNEARLIVNLVIADQREETLWDIMAGIEREARARNPELQVLFFQPLNPTPVAAARAPVEVLVKGPDLDQVYAYGRQIREIADTQSRGLHGPYLDKVFGVPQLRVDLDEARVQALGLTVADVVGQVYYAINGGFTQTFFNPEPMYLHSRLLIRYREDQRATPADLEDLQIKTPQGAMVPLKSIARIREGFGYDRIHTVDTLYAASVLGYYRELGLKETTLSLLLPSKMQIALPKGYAVGPAGLMATALQAFNELGVGLKVALVAVYLLLVVQFRSFAIAAVLMLAIPLQGLGAIGALTLRGMAWSPPVLWGMVVLAGIVLSNSILIVDKIVQLRAQGVDRHRAIVAASALRLRPVLMTALAVGAAMLPIAVYPPPQMEQFRNIATGITGGLITSTLMTLIVIPVAYSLMDDFVNLLRRAYFGAPGADEPAAEGAAAPAALQRDSEADTAADQEALPAAAPERRRHGL
ncbi:MAG: efflux RND transporter permease subunit [Gammaproteobacteria bacterium]|nr:MAG: efflux RND transporter permease subunit [Gammaproteobacteria bacterium]